MVAKVKELAPSRWIRWESVLFDLSLAATAFIFLTGGSDFLRGHLLTLIELKPWLHRLAITIPVALMLLWFAQREARIEQGRVRPSFVIQAVRSLGWSAKTWVNLTFVILSILWTASSWVRHQVFHSSFDMAIFVQAIWNTLHGSFLYSSIKGGICLLADHFSPILALFAFPYAFWPDPRLLLMIQAVSVASSVFPIFLLARRRLAKESLALIFVLTFALYLPIRNAVRFDFHPELLAVPLFFWGFWFLQEGRAWASSACLCFALMTKENAALVTFAMGFYGFFFVSKKKYWGTFWMVFSMTYFFMVLWLIRYGFRQDYFYLEANILSWRRYGAVPLMNHLFQISSLAYLVKIFMPVGFLSFLNLPAFSLTWPMLVQNLISRNEMTRSIFFQYTAYLTPFVFISAIEGGRKVLNRRGGGIYYLVGCALLLAGVSEYHVLRTHLVKWTPRIQEIHESFERIPPEASVRTHEFFAPHLAHRRELHIYENDHPREGGSARAQTAYLVIVEKERLGANADKAVLNLQARGYILKQEDQGLMVFTRKTAA